MRRGLNNETHLFCSPPLLKVEERGVLAEPGCPFATLGVDSDGESPCRLRPWRTLKAFELPIVGFGSGVEGALLEEPASAAPPRRRLAEMALMALTAAAVVEFISLAH